MLRLIQTFDVEDNSGLPQQFLGFLSKLLEDPDVVELMMSFYVSCSASVRARQAKAMRLKYKVFGRNTSIIEEEMMRIEERVERLKVEMVKELWWFLVDEPVKNVTKTSQLIGGLGAWERTSQLIFHSSLF